MVFTQFVNTNLSKIFEIMREIAAYTMLSYFVL